jgi:hypothetical protein
MCRGLDAERFAQTAGIPVDMSRIFAKPLCARDRCRSSKKSLNLGLIMIEKNFLTIHPGEILEEEFLKPIQRNLQSKMEI